jgi:oligopeptide/dipeptide ABC transporter ATP-binding protein
MVNRGFNEVYQLDGGIVRYGEKFGDSGLWQGSLYVFDNRMSIDFSPDPAVLGRCYACDAPTKNMRNCVDLSCREQLVVCDEPTSALDVSVQATILNLLVDLQKQDGTSFIFISHDLGVVRYISDKIAVLYLGRVVEFGDSNRVFQGPHHPYTEALLSSVPNIDGSIRKRIPLTGVIPSPSNPPTGCVLHPRCPRMAGSGVEHLCTSVEPELLETVPGHFMRCHIPLDQLRTVQTQ